MYESPAIETIGLLDELTLEPGSIGDFEPAN